MLPGMFISAIGSTVLGIALLRSHYTPKLTPWLLTLAFPSMLIIPTVLGRVSVLNRGAADPAPAPGPS